ncbi:MAG: DNA-directed RNA polymerase subunit omega [Huintestinicola sp.]
MLRPAMSQIATKNESYYSVVVGVAKRAREIADELYNNGQILEEKPVKTAVEEFAARKFSIIEDSSVKSSQSSSNKSE